MAVKPIPDGYHSVTPYLIIKGAAEAIDFYKKAFNAQELFRMQQPNGKIGHAEIKIGNSPIMMADEFPDWNMTGPDTRGGTTVSILIYTEDADTMFNQALAAGAKSLKPLQNQFYGDRSGSLTDPYGHVWTISTHVEDVPPEEIGRRAQEWAAKHGKAGECG